MKTRIHKLHHTNGPKIRQLNYGLSKPLLADDRRETLVSPAAVQLLGIEPRVPSRVLQFEVRGCGMTELTEAERLHDLWVAEMTAKIVDHYAATDAEMSPRDSLSSFVCDVVIGGDWSHDDLKSLLIRIAAWISNAYFERDPSRKGWE